jgi:transcriptional regulator with XRE-family HTH domain
MSSVGGLLREVRHAAGLTLEQLAERASTSVPTLSNYENGHKEPRLSTLSRIVEAAGSELRLDVRPAGMTRPMTRKDRRSLALHRVVAMRLATAPDDVRSIARRNLAHLRHVHADGSAEPYFLAWQELLDGPIDDLVDVLLNERQSARDLRQVSPFAGVLSEAERSRALAAA